MIEECPLPMRRNRRLSPQRFRDRIFQRLHPGGKRYPLIVRRNERVQVIWHENVVPHPRAMRGPL